MLCRDFEARFLGRNYTDYAIPASKPSLFHCTSFLYNMTHAQDLISCDFRVINPHPTAFPYGNGMVLHFYQQQESSTTKTVHKVINKGLKAYV